MCFKAEIRKCIPKIRFKISLYIIAHDGNTNHDEKWTQCCHKLFVINLLDMIYNKTIDAFVFV